MFMLVVEIFATFYMQGVPLPTYVTVAVNVPSIVTCRAGEATAERIFGNIPFQIAFDQRIGVAALVRAKCNIADAV